MINWKGLRALPPGTIIHHDEAHIKWELRIDKQGEEEIGASYRENAQSAWVWNPLVKTVLRDWSHNIPWSPMVVILLDEEW